jgi:hypothetical protein
VGKERDAETLLDHLLRGVDVVELHHASRNRSGAAEELVRQSVVARRAVEEDQLDVADPLRADRLLTDEGVVRVDDEHELVLVERCRLDLRVTQGPPEPDLHLLLEDEVEDLLGVPRPDRELHLWVRATEPGQDPGQDVGADSRGRPERELAALASRELAEEPAPGSRGAERPLGVGQERPAGVREPHPASGTDEKARAELLLEPLQPRRQRGLGDEERLGRAADAPPLGDLDECLQLFQSHRRLL